MAVTVVVKKAASGAPTGLLVPEASGFGHVGKRSVAIVAIKVVLSEVGTENVFVSVVVVVSDTDSGCPANRLETGFLSDVCKSAVALVFVEPISRFRRVDA